MTAPSRNGHAPDELTDEYYDAIYSRQPAERLTDPMPGDDLLDVLNEAATFLEHLAQDPAYRVTCWESQAMADAAEVLWQIFQGKRPTTGSVNVFGGGTFGGL